MNNFGVIGKLVKYLSVALLLVSPMFVMMTKTFAANTGDYPWADAEIINQYTYDWGYPSCRPEIESAGRCNTHVQYKWGVKYFQSDPWGYDIRNCTSYVAWRVNRDYGLNLSGWGNATTWDNSASGTYVVDNTPAVGDIAVWEGLYGHVAFVTHVNADGTFEIDQYNNAGAGEFSHQLRTSASHFIHVRPQTPSPPVSVLPDVPTVEPTVPEPAPIVVPEPISLEGVKVPEPSKLNYTSIPFQNTNEVDYLLEYTPNTEEINVFGIVHSNSKSGNIEINQSSLADGNSKFQQTKVSSIAVLPEKSTRFALADYNDDKILDLYVIKTNETKSQNIEISVLDGSSNYQLVILDTVTTQTSAASSDSIYKVADKDNDTKPDIFKITEKVDSDQTNFEILNGSTQYKSTLQSWNTKKEKTKQGYFIGDDDRDGKNDVYIVNSDESNTEQININIYDDSTDFLKSSRKIVVNKNLDTNEVIENNAEITASSGAS